MGFSSNAFVRHLWRKALQQKKGLFIQAFFNVKVFLNLTLAEVRKVLLCKPMLIFHQICYTFAVTSQAYDAQ